MKFNVQKAALAALMVASQHQDAQGFTPLAAPVATRTQSLRRNLIQRRMVMDRPDPLEIQVNDKRRSTDPTPALVSWFPETGNQFKFSLAALAMMAALALSPLNADAAMSGGRMGGSFSAPTTRSYSAPRVSGGYSGGSTFSRGYTAGYYSRPSTTIIAPGFGFGFNPFYSPGYYGGPGVISYSRGPSFFDLIFFGGFLFVAANIFQGMTRNATTDSGGGIMSSLVSDTASSALGSGTSVVQLSVAVEVPNRDDSNSLLGVLDRISRTARTDSRVGIQNLTSQVALELLRRKSSITGASGNSKHFRDRTSAGRDFQSRSIKERSKFESETVSKYGGVDYTQGGSSYNADRRLAGSGDKATMAVVTLVLAIDGDSTKIPNLNSVRDVEEALRKIASDAKVDDCLQSAEILWTPEDRSETLSMRDVLADYPELRSM